MEYRITTTTPAIVTRALNAAGDLLSGVGAQEQQVTQQQTTPTPTTAAEQKQGDQVDASRIIRGYAIVWDVPSVVLCDNFGTFIETIDRHALTAEKLKTFDIRALLEHNPERLLARWRAGTGTLRLTIDDHGLMYEFDAPHTADGDTCLELVRRSDIIGSSFAYLCDEDSVIWGRDPDGTPTRLVTDITYMEDVSIVSRPAYNQTSVTARDLVKRGYTPNDTRAAEMAKYIASARREADVWRNL